MRILILSINYWPEETGIGAFTTCRAEYLASAGHDVTVCTTFPYYPHWKVAAEYKGRFLASEERNGVRIIRSYAYIPTALGVVKRIVHEASFVASSFLASLFVRRPDVLLVVSPPLGLAMSGILLSGLWRIPYVFDVEDLQPDAAATLGMLPQWALRMMYWLERRAYRHASLVSTITNGMRDRIIGKGVPPRKVALFEPRLDEALTDIAPSEGSWFRQKYGFDGKFIASHSGNMGEKQGLDVILDAASLCRNDTSMLFLIVGNGSVREQIELRAAELRLQNVRILPLLNSQEFRGLLAASDVTLVTQRKAVLDIVFPSKVVTYLAAGKPVIASVSASSEVACTIRDSGAGVVVEPENPEALRSAIYAFRDGSLDERGRLARAYAKTRWSPARVLGSLEASLVETFTASNESKPNHKSKARCSNELTNNKL